MANVFQDSKGVISIAYRKKGKTDTALFYAESFGRSDSESQEMRPHLAEKKVLFQQEYEAAQTFCPCRGQFDQNGQRNAVPFIFCQNWPCAAFLFRNLKNHSMRKDLSPMRSSLPHTEACLENPGEVIFSKRAKEADTLSGQLYRTKRRLY